MPRLVPRPTSEAISNRSAFFWIFGIPDISLAMREGYSTATPEMREMGFGAGMGLPNIQKNADRFEIASEVGRGTSLGIFFDLRPRPEEPR